MVIVLTQDNEGGDAVETLIHIGSVMDNGAVEADPLAVIDILTDIVISMMLFIETSRGNVLDRSENLIPVMKDIHIPHDSEDIMHEIKGFHLGGTVETGLEAMTGYTGTDEELFLLSPMRLVNVPHMHEEGGFHFGFESADL